MYQRILVPVDGSDTSDAGLAQAIGLAKSCGGPLRLIHVLEDQSLGFGMAAWGEYPGDWLTVLRDNGRDVLESGAAKAKAAGVPAEIFLHDAFLGSLADIVRNEAAHWPAELIVLGTHGRRGVGRLLLGSDAERIVRSSHVPVLLVRGAEAALPRTGAMSAVEDLCAATTRAAVAAG